MRPDMIDIRDRLAGLENHFLFSYRGRDCGVDPIAKNKYNIWFGNKHSHVDTIDAVFEVPFWGGKKITDIFEDISIIEY